MARLAALAALLICAGAGVVASSAVPVVQFPGPGVELSQLPGASILNPGGLVRNINIRLVAATVEGPTGSDGKMLRFNSPLYQSPAGIFLQGPTLRLKAGDSYTITLTNDLPVADPNARPKATDTGFAGPTHTNVHTHGIHSATGLQAQTMPVEYTGGDNVLVHVHPAGGKLKWYDELPTDHLPGLHWYHPHKHGASTVQTFTANGLIVVEDDPKWLPDANGCANVKKALSGSKDVLIHFALFSFAPPNPFNDSATAGFYDFIGPFFASLDDINVQTASKLSDPMNPVMAEGHNGRSGVSGTARSRDIVLVNGGWQPKLSMKAGEWQRWRMVHTGYKRFLDLQIVEAVSGNPAPRCQMMLLAKDGLYLPLLPRSVDHAFLTAGSRAELLVRCLDAGKYVLTAGRRPSPFGPAFGSLSWLRQKVVLTLAVAAAGKPAKAGPELAARSCQPLFPSYAADLSDASLKKAGATGKLLPQEASFTFGNQLYGCLVNDKNFSYPDPQPLRMPLGKVVEWTFQNLMEHPLHLHTNPFQIMDLPPAFLPADNRYTSWFEKGDRHDTLQLPMMANPTNVTNAAIALRVQPGPFTGYSVMHCHFIHHEDEGCMKMVKWECPGHADPQPEVCPGFNFPVKGTYV